MRTLRIVVAYLGPPVIWSGHLLFAYLFASLTCAYGGTATVRTLIALLTALALAGITACGWMGFTHASELEALPWHDAERRMHSRAFMSRATIYLALLFFIATMFGAAPAFALQSC